MITKTEAMRQAHQENVLLSLGFTFEEARNLRRISMALRRWFERECGIDGGAIERDPDTGRPYWISEDNGRGPRRRWPVADRETGALKRLGAIMAARNSRTPPLSVVMLPDRAAPDTLTAYIQTDPRGAALYILRPGDVPEGKDPGAYYTRGICIY